MFRIKDHSKPEWASFTYPTRAQAERDMFMAFMYHAQNGSPRPALYVQEV